MEDDPLDNLLGLEDHYYQEGYELGVKDGTQAGLIEGRFFGLEKGFEKYAAMGTLHGRSAVWAGRLARHPRETAGNETSEHLAAVNHCRQKQHRLNRECQVSEGEGSITPLSRPLCQIPYSARLEKHIRILYALTEPSSLSAKNNEDSVSDFDDRLKRADGKMKIIEKLLDESNFDTRSTAEPNFRPRAADEHASRIDASIEHMRYDTG